MRKIIIMTAVSLVVLCSCGEYNAVLKSSDYEYKYEVAKACYVRGEYGHAADLFSDVTTADFSVLRVIVSVALIVFGGLSVKMLL